MEAYLGPLAAIGVFTATQVGSLIWVLSRTARDASALKEQLGKLQEEMEKLGNVLVTLADFRGEINLVSERQNAQAKRLDEQQLRHTKQIDEIYKRLWEKREEKGKYGE